MDLADLKPTLDKDRKQIQRELDRWQAAQSPQEITPPDPLVMNLGAHFALKQAFLKTEEAEQLAQERPEVYAAMRMHLQQIQLLLNPPAPAAHQPGAALNDMVSKGVLTPQAPNAGASVGQLVSAGVLTPGAGAPGAVH
jgi:hypothetical protein